MPCLFWYFHRYHKYTMNLPRSWPKYRLTKFLLEIKLISFLIFFSPSKPTADTSQPYINNINIWSYYRIQTGHNKPYRVAIIIITTTREGNHLCNCPRTTWLTWGSWGALKIGDVIKTNINIQNHILFSAALRGFGSSSQTREGCAHI